MLGRAGARQFLEGFLPGWVTGGSVALGAPLGHWERAAVQALVAEGGIAERLQAARLKNAQKTLRECPPPPWDRRDLDLLIGVYNLFALSHPLFDGRPGRPDRRAVGDYSRELLLDLPSPKSVEGAAWAHSVVGPVFEASRIDATVQTWAGRHELRGRPVPAGLLRFRRLRRVRVHGKTLAGIASFQNNEQQLILDKLLLRSPLTDLMQAGRDRPRFQMGGLAKWLSHPELCRSVLYAWVSAKSPAACAGAVMRALQVRSRGGERAEALRLMISALYELHLLLLLETLHRGEPPPDQGTLLGRWTQAAEPAYYVCFVRELRRRALGGLIPADARFGPALEARLRAFDVLVAPLGGALAAGLVREVLDGAQLPASSPTGPQPARLPSATKLR